MTQDPYQLNNDDLQLTAAPEDDSGDEYDGLEVASIEEKQGVKKMPIVLGVVALAAIAGAGFVTYQIFGVDTAPIIPQQPPVVANALPPGAEPMPAAPVDPNAPPVAEAPAIDPTTGQPIVTAEAVPAPTDAAAIPADENAPVPADTAAMPPAADANAVPPAPPADALAQAPTDTTKPVVEEKPAATDAAKTDVVKDVADAKDATEEFDTPPALKQIAHNEAQKTEATPTVTPALPDPAAEQLKPIDPGAVTAKAAGDATAQVDKKTADKVAAVNEILGNENAAVSPKVQDRIAREVEVTPRAREVIIVRKAYNADSAQAIVAAGDRVLDAKQYGAAAEIYDRQLKKNPSDPSALAGKAIALQRAGNTVEAMNTYERLLDLNPRDLEALTNYLGLLQKQNPAQALTRLQNLGRQYPENAAIAGQTAMVYASMMDTPNALRFFNKAAALDQTNATYPFNLGVLYDRLGTTQKARDAYIKALAVSRAYPDKAGSIPVETIRNRLSTM